MHSYIAIVSISIRFTADTCALEAGSKTGLYKLTGRWHNSPLLNV